MKALNLSLGSAAAIIVSLIASTALAAAPVISNISSVPSTTSAVISWTTDVPATSQVGYGTSASTSPYNNESDFESALVTSHSVTLNSLTSGTLYNFAVISDIASTSTSTASSTETSTSDNFTFTTLSDQIPTSTPTSTPTTTPSDLDNLIDQLKDLQNQFPSFVTQIQNTIDQLLGNGGTGTSTPPITGTGHIDQDGQTRTAGSHIDFVGHNFGHEETVLIVREGVPIGSAHADGAGNFSTGAMSVPGTPDTYTYTFTGQTSGIVGTAIITVE